MSLDTFTLDELDGRSRRAEYYMNLALEQRRWNMVRHHRGEMLAVTAERDRRVDALDDRATT